MCFFFFCWSLISAKDTLLNQLFIVLSANTHDWMLITEQMVPGTRLLSANGVNFMTDTVTSNRAKIKMSKIFKRYFPWSSEDGDFHTYQKSA